MSRQDRQGVRLPADLERKYNFGKAFKDQNQNSTRQSEQLNQLSKDLAEFMSSTRIALEELGKAIEEAKQSSASLPALQKTVDDLEREHTYFRDEIGHLQEDVESLDGRVTALETE